MLTCTKIKRTTIYVKCRSTTAISPRYFNGIGGSASIYYFNTREFNCHSFQNVYFLHKTTSFNRLINPLTLYISYIWSKLKTILHIIITCSCYSLVKWLNAKKGFRSESDLIDSRLNCVFYIIKFWTVIIQNLSKYHKLLLCFLYFICSLSLVRCI